MTRLFTDGAESGDMLRLTTSSLLITTTKRTGTYSYSNNTISGRYATKVLPATYSEFYVRFAVAVETLSGLARRVFEWLSAATVVGGLVFDNNMGAAATVHVNVGDTSVATSSPIDFKGNDWHVFEIHVLLSTNPALGKIQVKYDGTQILNYTGNTGSTATTMNGIQFGMITLANNPNAYFDDVAVNDVAGGVDNSWCGDGGVLAALVPITGAAEYTDLIPSTGNAWDCVNEIPANADYVYESTVDKKSTYLLSDLAGLPSGASIARVWVELDALETAADGDKIATLLRSGATDAQGADQVLTLAYARYLSAEYLVDPAGGEDPTWTEARVNSLQAGAVVR